MCFYSPQPLLLRTKHSRNMYQEYISDTVQHVVSEGATKSHNTPKPSKPGLEETLATDKITPHEWLNVTILRTKNNKRQWVSSIPSPQDEIPLKNQFARLPMGVTGDPNRQQSKIKENKPPPIILYGIQDIRKLTDLVETVLSKSDYTYKIISKQQLKITTKALDIYTLLIQLIRKEGLIGHTFSRKDERAYRIVVKNFSSIHLHPWK